MCSPEAVQMCNPVNCAVLDEPVIEDRENTQGDEDESRDLLVDSVKIKVLQVHGVSVVALEGRNPRELGFQIPKLYSRSIWAIREGFGLKKA